MVTARVVDGVMTINIFPLTLGEGKGEGVVEKPGEESLSSLSPLPDPLP